MTSRRHFITTGVGLGLAALTLPASVWAATPGILKAGAGRAEVKFASDHFPLGEFTAQHDPLSARVLLLETGDRRLAMVVIDITSLTDEMIAAFKKIITKMNGVRAEDCIVSAAHNFSAPHIFPGNHRPPDSDAATNAYVASAFEAAVREASRQAQAALQPARIGFGAGASQVNVNRDVSTPQGWWLGANPQGFADPFVGVVRIDGKNGKPLAILMNYAVQSAVMDESTLTTGGRAISADLAGTAARHVEQAFGPDTVALFLVGAAGDQSPREQAAPHVLDAQGQDTRNDMHEKGFAIVDRLGNELGAEVVQVARDINTQDNRKIGVVRAGIAVKALDYSPRDRPTGPITHGTYKEKGQINVPVVLMRLGDIVLVGLQPELAATIGARIREGSPYPHTLVCTMVDGGAKYMPDAASYDHFTYEARNSPFAKGTAEAVAEAVKEMLGQLQATAK